MLAVGDLLQITGNVAFTEVGNEDIAMRCNGIRASNNLVLQRRTGEVLVSLYEIARLLVAQVTLLYEGVPMLEYFRDDFLRLRTSDIYILCTTAETLKVPTTELKRQCIRTLLSQQEV